MRGTAIALSPRWKSACDAQHKDLDVRARSHGVQQSMAGCAWLTCGRRLQPGGGYFTPRHDYPSTRLRDTSAAAGAAPPAVWPTKTNALARGRPPPPPTFAPAATRSHPAGRLPWTLRKRRRGAPLNDEVAIAIKQRVLFDVARSAQRSLLCREPIP